MSLMMQTRGNLWKSLPRSYRDRNQMFDKFSHIMKQHRFLSPSRQWFIYQKLEEIGGKFSSSCSSPGLVQSWDRGRIGLHCLSQVS